MTTIQNSFNTYLMVVVTTKNARGKRSGVNTLKIGEKKDISESEDGRKWELVELCKFGV